MKICDDAPKDWGRAEKAKDPSGTESVANGLIDTVTARNLDVESIRLQPTDLECHDDVISAIQSSPLLCRCLDARGEFVAGDECARCAGSPLQSSRVDIHQRERALLELGVTEDVADESQRKDVPTRANDRNL